MYYESEQIQLDLRIDDWKAQCLAARVSNKIVCAKYKLTYIDGRKLFNMTPQEEQLFADFFNNEKHVIVKDMDDLTLQAHREELAKIAFEARARLTAADDVIKERKPRKTNGLTRSVADAINTIKERSVRLSKHEKLIKGLVKLGLTREDAEKRMSAGAELALKNKQGIAPPKLEFENTTEQAKSVEAHKLIEKITEQVIEDTAKQAKTFVNPFAKKS